MTPTERSLRKLRADGYLAEVVERFNAFAKVRNDLYGIGDVLAIKPGAVLLVQATSRSNVSARVFKLRGHENLLPVLRAGIRVEVWGWARMASGRVECRIVDMAEHLETTSIGNENPRE